MTIKERAEKIVSVWSVQGFKSSQEAIVYITSQINEAVLQTRIEMKEGLVYDEGVAWGFSEAREMAAKLADDEFGCDALAEQIRAMSPIVSSTEQS